MPTLTRAACLALLCLITTGHLASSVELEPVKAVCARGMIITCVDVEGEVRLLVSSGLSAPKPLSLLCSAVTAPPLRWQVGHGRVWVSNTHMEAVGVYNYELAPLALGRLVSLPFGEDIHIPFAGANPIADMRDLGKFAKFKTEIHSDYLSLSQTRPGLAVLTNIRGREVPIKPVSGGPSGGSRIVITDEERKNPRWSFGLYEDRKQFDKGDPLGPWHKDDWWQFETLEPAFQEPFQAVVQGKRYYFITSSGTLYCTGARRILTGQRSVDCIWSDPTRPITHFLTDADTDRTFLFCKPAREGEAGVYFELGPKPEPKPYDLSRVKPSKAAEPLKGVLERARFLAAQNLLKHPDPPKDEKKP